MAAEVSSIKDLTKSLKTYMDSDQLEQVKKAFFFAANAHSGQYRVSGDPYVTHPVAVAEILAKFKMDGDSLSAAMLHDVIEDSGIPKSFLSKEFNKDVANLVDGVSKLDKIKISVENRSIDLLVDEAELENRRQKLVSNVTTKYNRGYKKLYYETVLQADGGCDFDFLRDPSLLKNEAKTDDY